MGFGANANSANRNGGANSANRSGSRSGSGGGGGMQGSSRTGRTGGQGNGGQVKKYAQDPTYLLRTLLSPKIRSAPSKSPDSRINISPQSLQILRKSNQLRVSGSFGPPKTRRASEKETDAAASSSKLYGGIYDVDDGTELYNKSVDADKINESNESNESNEFNEINDIDGPENSKFLIGGESYEAEQGALVEQDETNLETDDANWKSDEAPTVQAAVAAELNYSLQFEEEGEATVGKDARTLREEEVAQSLKHANTQDMSTQALSSSKCNNQNTNTHI
jgi:hypothetical protein